METVFQTNLAVDAHLVRDLLERAGIPATLAGEYLQGAMGELPLDGSVRVRVAMEHAKEAREVIAEWEKAAPESDAAPEHPESPRKRASSWAPYTFVLGGALGFLAAWFHFNTPVTRDGVDYDDDGKQEERYVYDGMKLTLSEFDRNSDGNTDVRYEYDTHGLPKGAKMDDDFDGKFEGRMRLVKGQPGETEYDRDGDGFFEEILRFRNGVLSQLDYVSPSTRAVIKRSSFRSGVLTSADYDADSDGAFERHVEYDEIGDPRT